MQTDKAAGLRRVLETEETPMEKSLREFLSYVCLALPPAPRTPTRRSLWKLRLYPTAARFMQRNRPRWFWRIPPP